MAACFMRKHASLLFLFLACSFIQTHARESEFFSKVSRPQKPAEATQAAGESPALDEVDPRTLTPQSHNGYGLYGRDSERFSPTTDTYRGGAADDREYRPAGRGANPAATLWTNGRKNRQQYGMSDTRFMANGRYFYDVNDEREHNGGYEVSSDQGSRNPDQGYDQYNGFGSRRSGGGYGGRSGMNGYEAKAEYESDHGYENEELAP